MQVLSTKLNGTVITGTTFSSFSVIKSIPQSSPTLILTMNNFWSYCSHAQNVFGKKHTIKIM